MAQSFSSSSSSSAGQQASHDELLAEAFRDHKPSARNEADALIDEAFDTPTVGSLDLAERNSFRRVIRDTEIRSEDHEDIYEVEYLSLIHI